jgi:hypothetical protein
MPIVPLGQQYSRSHRRGGGIGHRQIAGQTHFQSIRDIAQACAGQSPFK